MDSSALTIERRDQLSYGEFARKYLYPLRPVIVTDALSSWPAMRRWTPEFFKDKFGAVEFSTYGAEYEHYETSSAPVPRFSLSGYIDRVVSSSAEHPVPYLRNKVLADAFPSLTTDVSPLPQYMFPNWLGEPFLVKHVRDVLNRGAALELFIGGVGSTFPVLHYDGAGTHAFLMQIYGRKEFVLYPPDQEGFLYPMPEKENHSLVDIAHPDLTKYPSFAEAVPMKFVLEPGELLFIPSHWWHTTKMLTTSITVAVNVLNQSNWHELLKFVNRKRRNPMVSIASRVYLRGAGAWRAWRDRGWRQGTSRYTSVA
jgi:histone arginine demethylase JMJD6